MPTPSQSFAAALGLAAGAAALRRRRRRRDDPVHAPGHRHRDPAPEVDIPPSSKPGAGHDQPWVRHSHSDSQKRRFRR